MVSDERARLVRRVQDLRRLLDGFIDRGARAAINQEIAKYDALIRAIDKNTLA
jgi:hypothetical protein